MLIRQGTMEDAKEIGELYDKLCDYLDQTTNYPGWKKGIYPTIDDAIAGIKQNKLYVAVQNEEIIGTIILLHEHEDGYAMVKWQKELSDEKIYVIHTLAVHPNHLKDHVGTKLLRFAENLARFNGMQAIRLDVVQDNLPAIQMYEKEGYAYIDTVDLGYSEYGIDWFQLYEKLL